MKMTAGKSENTGIIPAQKLERRYKNSMLSLLLIVIFSSVNLLLLLTNSDKYFLFSAYIPYLLGDYAMFYSGRYPAEYYADVSETVFMTDGLFAVTVSIACLVILFYAVSWFFARRKKAVWLVFSLGLFVVDTLVMFVVVGVYYEMLIDIIFHIWAIVSLSLGVSAYMKLRKLSEEEKKASFVPVSANQQNDTAMYDSPVLRTYDPEENIKIFVEAEYESLHIIFRRTRRCNELVVNGNVYAQYQVITENAHTLAADVGGYRVEAVYDGRFSCYINVDGRTVASGKRLI